MEDKFQQLYGYLEASNLLAEGSTPESFMESYTTGGKNPNKLYQTLGVSDDLPFEIGNSLDEFTSEFFGVKKKESTEGGESTEGSPLEEVSMGSLSGTNQEQIPTSGDSDYTVRPKLGLGQVEVSEERQFLKGTTGSIVNSIPVLGGFVDDMARAGAIGWSDVQTRDEARWMFGSRDRESVSAFYKSMTEHQARVAEYGESSEMKAYQSDLAKYQKEDGEWFGFFKAFANNLSVAPEVFLTSGIGLLETEVLDKGAEVVAIAGVGGATLGGSLSAPAGGIGALPGMALGMTTSIPFAMAAMSKEVELISSSVEFLNEELKAQGLEFTEENIWAVISDDESYKKIRNRAISRGNSVMAVDAIFGSVGSGVLRGLRVANKIKDVSLVAAQIGIDVAGGATSETLARLNADQELSASEIGMEMLIGPITTTPTNLASTYLGMQVQKNQRAAGTKTEYMINGGYVDKATLIDFVETADPDQIQKANIDIQNDQEVSEMISQKIKAAEIELGIDESITGETRAKLIELETQLSNLEGVTTRTADNRRKQVQGEIDNILDKIDTSLTSDIQYVEVNTEVIKSNTAKKSSEISLLPLEAEDGATFNLDGTSYEGGGLVVPVDSKNMKASELTPEAIAQFAEENREKIGDDTVIKLGIYKFPGKDQVSIDLNIVVPPEKRAAALEFGRLAGQESLFDLDTFENVKTGATGNNPRSFSPAEFQQVAKDLKEGKVSDFMMEEGLPASDTPVPSNLNEEEKIIEEAEAEGTRMNEEERLAAAQELQDKAEQDGVYFKKPFSIKGMAADIIKGRTAFQRRWLQARKFMPSSVFRATEKKDAKLSKSMNVIQKNVKAFNSLEKAVPKDQRNQFAEEFDNYVRGGERGSLSNEATLLADKMRADIDALTIDLVNQGVVEASAVDAFISNMGEYMNRSYRLYEQSNWKEQLKTEEGQGIVNRAKNFIRQTDKVLLKKAKADYLKPEANPQNLSLEDFIELRIQGKIDNLLGEQGQAFSASPSVSKDLGVLQERETIPLEIRALMGEFTDPVQNYAQTVLKMSQLAESNRMLQSVKDAGMGTYLFSEPTGAFSVQIASEGSDTKSPLNGLYTTQEIADSFQSTIKGEPKPGSAEYVMKSLGDSYMATLGTVKWVKTIGSVGTHFKNVVGNFGFMASNGHTDLSKVGETFRIIKEDLSPMGDQELQDKMNKYIELGIVRQNADLGEFRDLLKMGSLDDIVSSRLQTNPDQGTNKVKAKAGQVKAKAKEGKAAAEATYQAEDDFFKIIAYENERARYSLAEFGLPPEKLTADQSVQLDSKVAEIVKNTYPTYSRVPELVKLLKINPLVGNFVSFQAESYRTAWNIVNLARTELSSENPEVRKIGAKRMAGLTSYQAFKTGFVATTAAGLGMGATGLAGAATSDEKQLQKEADARKFLPPWSEKSQLWMEELGEGKMAYRDLSASDPFGNIDKILNSATSEDNPIEGFVSAMRQTVEPFVGMDIATRRFANIAANKDDYGKEIYNESQSIDEQMKDISAYVYTVFEPGTMTSIRKIAGSDTPINEAVGQTTGFKRFDVDISKQFGYKMRNFKKQISDARKIRYEDYKQGSLVFEKPSLDEANKTLKSIEVEIKELALSAVRLGVPYEDIKKAMQEYGNISKSRVDKILLGEYEELGFDL